MYRLKTCLYIVSGGAEAHMKERSCIALCIEELDMPVYTVSVSALIKVDTRDTTIMILCYIVVLYTCITII